MKKLIILAAAALMLAGCGKKFTVSGEVSDAAGETIYLEHCGLLQNQVIDSAVIKSTGAFSFKAERPDCPDLYRLRLNGKVLMLAIDSLETISLTANAELGNPVFEGSDKSQRIHELRVSLRDSSPADHKQMAQKYIMDDPGSMVAYYALFQQKAGLPVFDMYNKDDRRFFQAVATSLNTWFPNSDRTKVLYQQVLELMNNERRAQNAAIMQAFIDEQESSFLDITLKDNHDQEQSLSQYKGKVIVLDFASIQMERYAAYVLEMRELWNTYHDKGVEVYEVYPDQNKLTWEDVVDALPWTTVRTEEGLYNPVYSTYNVQAIPTMFVYNRKGEIIGRFGDFQSLKKALDNALK